MRLNEKEVSLNSSRKATKEGRLNHKYPNAGFREGYKERWFKLIGNLLYYFRVNEYGGVLKQPAGVFVIENCHAQHEDIPVRFAFSLTFESEPDKKHWLACNNQTQCDEWVVAINEASYQYQRKQISRMRQKIIEMTGNDPIPFCQFMDSQLQSQPQSQSQSQLSSFSLLQL